MRLLHSSSADAPAPPGHAGPPPAGGPVDRGLASPGRLAAVGGHVLLLAVLGLGCELVSISGADSDVAVRLELTPESVAMARGDSAEFTAVAFTGSGDTADVEVSWETTGGVLTAGTSGSGEGEGGGRGKHRGWYESGTCGEFEVTATGQPGNVSDVSDVTVTCDEPAPVASVTVRPGTATLEVDETVQLTAEARDSEGRLLPGRTFAWGSDDEAVATVDGSGRVTGRGEGTATITATAGGESGTATVTVEAASVSDPAEVLAFPGAEGFGRMARGGRGGTVYLVTNTNDAGAGSLRACVEAKGPRTCVFRVAGTISLASDLDIEDPYITIAGQTAPGGGITLKSADPASSDHLRVETHDVIIRYIRSRPGTSAENARALTVSNSDAAPHDVMIDHVSLSWSGDEIFISWYDARDITVQWSSLSESLPYQDGGYKGPNLGDGGLSGRLTFHHNLLAHHNQRFPLTRTGEGPIDLVNNVMYNLGTYGHANLRESTKANLVGNYVKPGPNSTIETFVRDESLTDGGYYHGGNVVEAGWSVESFASDDHRVSTRYDAPPVTTTGAERAYEDVLANAGAVHGLRCDGTWFDRPDAVDVRIAESVREGTRGHDIPPEQTPQQLGFLSDPADVGGWPSLDPGTPCADGDADGMPDVWEEAVGLDPGADDSAGDLDGDGYTNLEEYLNGTAP